jgi:primary-amine oxidase
MSQWRFSTLVALGGCFSLALLAGAPAQQQDAGQDSAAPKPPPALKETVVEFPSNDVMRTAWKVHWTTTDGFGLIVSGAWFKKGPQEPWFQILGEVRLSEMFVPYHSGSPRFWDVSYSFALVNLTRDDAGAHGRLIGNRPVVCQEIRDRGIAWMDGTKGSRRGQTMVLWACLNAANYRYVIEYGFQDDGAITCRVGSTGRNYGSREFEGHMHNGLWRVHVKLGGTPTNSVYLMEHVEPDGDLAKAKTVHRLFNQGREGFEDWHAAKFTMLSVRSEKMRNARKMPIAYDLMTPKMGNARHHGGQDEACTQHDFWVTKNRPGEVSYQHVPRYVQKGESIQNTDVVVWLSTAGHHEPRSEDGEMSKDSSFTGATPIMWTGFELRPRDFWDRSPLYP